jgi:Fe/S biogenesis protein NfuA
MITFTEHARTTVKQYMDQAENGCIGLRMRAVPQGRHRFRHELTLVLADEARDDDVTIDAGLFTVYIDPASATHLEGATVDFVTDLKGSGFKIDAPASVVAWDDPIAQKVQQVIDEKIAPAVASHGGWVDLVAVEGDAAIIEMGGGCQGCGMSHVTLAQGIEAAIVDEVPEIRRVLDHTDHDAGADPYIQR